MKLSRREALATGAGLLTLPAGLAAAPAATGQRLWYRQPAGRWEEALPLGNGRLGHEEGEG